MTLSDWVVCPLCQSALQEEAQQLRCHRCERCFPVYLGIPDFRSAAGYNSGSWGEERALLPRLIACFPNVDLSSLLEELLIGLKGRSDRDRQHLREYFVRDLAARAKNRIQTIDFVCEKSGKKPNFSAILEVGCGAGATLFELSKRGQAVGIEPNLLHLIIAKKHAQELRLPVRFVCGFAEQMPFRDGDFSFVHATDTFEHFADQQKGLAEIKRILSADGDAVFDVPNRYSLWREPHTKIWGIGFLPRRLTATTLRGIRNLSLWRVKQLVRQSFKENGAVFSMLVRFQVPGYRANSTALRLVAKVLQTAESVPVVRSVVRFFQPGFEVIVWK